MINIRLFFLTRTKQVVFNLKSGTVAKGIVWDTKFGWVVLKNPTILSDTGEWVAADGDLVLGIGNIDFIQVL